MNKNQKQNLIVVIVAVGIVLISALVTVGFTSGILTGDADQDRGFQNITFTDATLTCEEELVDEFGSRLAQKMVDNHSSRFENQVGLYKIFFKAYTSKHDVTTEYFVTCFVRARNGRIAKFEVAENKEAPKGKAIMKHGEKFIQWPQ